MRALEIFRQEVEILHHRPHLGVPEDEREPRDGLMPVADASQLTTPEPRMCQAVAQCRSMASNRASTEKSFKSTSANASW